MCVCVCLCLSGHIPPMKRLFVLKTLSRTQRATKVKKFVGICLKRLRSRVIPRNMSEKANMLIIPTYPRSAFSTGHTAKHQKVPNDCQPHSALPKTMPTDASLALPPLCAKRGRGSGLSSINDLFQSTENRCLPIRLQNDQLEAFLAYVTSRYRGMCKFSTQKTRS